MLLGLLVLRLTGRWQSGNSTTKQVANRRHWLSVAVSCNRKEQFPWVYEVTKCAVEGAFMDVAAAFKNFFEGRKAGRKTGYPKFKSKRRSRPSFYLANDKFTVGDHWIDVPKLGRVNMAETLRFSGKILSARISKMADWWFVSITVEMPDDIPLKTHPPVGVDVGLNRLATLSDGRRYENQRPLGHQLKKLRRLNKATGTTTIGGKNWHKTKDKVGRAHFGIASLRLDLLHKLTTEIATTSGLVAVEDLHVKGLIRNRCLSPLILRRGSRQAAGNGGCRLSES